MEVARRYTAAGSSSRRQRTHQFYVKTVALSVWVCKVAFLRVHSVSNGRLDQALKAEEITSPHCDERGRHPPKNKTTDEKIEVKEHIRSFPHYKSHYSRKDNPHRQFFSRSLSIQVMYRLYKETCEEKHTQPVSQWVYRRVFNESFNLSFGK